MTKRNLVRDYWDSIRNHDFWLYATWLGIITKYRKSKLGIAWVVMPTATYAFGIGYLYGLMMHRDHTVFIAHLGIGYVIFKFVTGIIRRSSGACVGNASFILDGRVRLTDYVLRVMADAAFELICAIPVLIIAVWLLPDFHWISLLEATPGMVLTLLNIAWLAVLLAVVGARFRDMYEVIGSALLFGFLFTPIIWKASLAPIGTFRGTIARINPLFHIVESIRAPILGHAVAHSTYLYLLVMLVIGWPLAMFVYNRYARFVPIWV